jgi:hypothetical protein
MCDECVTEDLTTTIEGLEKQVSDLASSLRKVNTDVEYKNEKLKEWIEGERDCYNLQECQIEFLCELFDITLSKTYDVTISVDYTFSVTLPTNVDIDDFINSEITVQDLDCYDYTLEDESSEVSSSDWSVR